MNKTSFKFSVLIKIVRKISFVVIFSFMILNVTAQQYNVVSNEGQAVETSPGCYQLTDACSQGAALWNIYKIDLTQPFDITLTLNFGNRPNIYYDNCVNCGADGMTFCLQPLSNSIIATGGSLGVDATISPSVFVAMDTYSWNPTDPLFQHISINSNGDVTHTQFTPAGTCPSAGGTVSVTNPNELVSYCNASSWPCTAADANCLTDGLDHLFHFVWTPTNPGTTGPGTISAYLGFGNPSVLPAQPTITYTGDIINNIFGGNPNVYWGVTGSTGGCYNIQTVCMTTISNFSSDTTVCAGQPLEFMDNSVSGLPITTYSWDFGDGTAGYTDTVWHTFNTPGTFAVNLFIMNSGGFTSTMTHMVTVYPNPTVVVNDTSICSGNTATLSASGANSYIWKYSGDSSIANPLIVSPSVTTSYIVTGTNSFGCTNTDTAVVTIYPNPIITVNSPAICAGDTATLTASGGVSYLWTNSGDTINPLFVSPTVTTQYVVVGTNVFGCSHDTNTTVTVNPNPIINVANDTICLYSTATLNATGALTYTWSVNGTVVSTSDPLSVTPANTTTYTVVGTDANNCIGTDSATVIVNLSSPISIDSVGICIGYTAALTVIGGNNDLTYLWLNNGSTFNPLHVSPTATTLYTVIATNPDGCKDTASGYVYVYPNPIPNFSFSPTVVSNDAPLVVFTDQSTYASYWSWNFGDINSTSDTSSIESPTHSYTVPGTFTIWLRVTSAFGCEDSTSRTIRVIAPVEFYVPNAFDPTSTNSDINVFKPKGAGIDVERYEMVIFDRWGKELFSTTDWNEGWNGKYNNVGDVLTHGVYVYYIKYKELYGTYRELTGSVTLIR